MLWDQSLIDKMLAEFPATDNRFSSPAGAVVQSRPFRFRRGRALKAAGRRRAEPAKSAAAACSAIDP